MDRFEWRDPTPEEPLPFDAAILRCATAGKATRGQLEQWLDRDLLQVGLLLLRAREVLLELNRPLCSCNGMGKCAVCHGRALISDMDAAANALWPGMKNVLAEEGPFGRRAGDQPAQITD